MARLPWGRRRRHPALPEGRELSTGQPTDQRVEAGQDPDRRELAVRLAAGIRVALFWRPAHDDVMVSVHDRRTGERFELTVARERALHAFHHPYVYAA